MSAPVASVLRAGEALERARSILPVIEENRDWADEHGRMAPAVLEAAQRIGLFFATSPVEIGGWDTPFPELMQIFEEISYHDPTVGWHMGNSFVLAGRMIRFLEPRYREQILAGPRGPYGLAGAICGKGTPVDGGYMVSGEWPFMTGCLDAAWACVQGVVEDAGGPAADGDAPRQPDLRVFIVPASDLRPKDNWTGAAAMRGTGSNSVSVNNVFVPAGLALPLLAPGIPNIESHNGKLPVGAVSQVTVAAIMTGVARRAVDEVTTRTAAKVGRMDGMIYRQNLSMQRLIAKSSTTIDALRAVQQSMAKEVWERTLAGTLDNADRARMWGVMVWSMDMTREVVSDCMTLATSSVYAERNRVEAALRDVHSMAASFEPIRNTQEAAGRIALGMPPNAPPFFV